MKNPFLDELHFDNGGMRNGRRCIILTSRLRAITSLGLVEAPAGFVSDGGSIPDAAVPLVGDGFGDALEEFVIHDLLYSEQNKEFSRDEADLILKELLWNCILRSKLKPWQKAKSFARIMAIYTAVRIAGGSRFKAHLRTLP